MASWRDTLRPASFRGVPFEAQSRRWAGGRRLALHEYPDRDESYPEDLGRKARTYGVQAYLIGDDCKAKRDKLVEALETKGPGEYVDLWGDAWQVVVQGYTVAENIQAGRFVEITIDFVEWAPPVQHKASTDTAHASRRAASSARPGLVTAFGDGGAFLARPADTLAHFGGALAASLGATVARAAVGAVAGAVLPALADGVSMVLGDGWTDGLRDAAAAVADVADVLRVDRQLQQFAAELPGLSAPLAVAGRVAGVIDDALGIVPAGRSRFAAAAGLLSFSLDAAGAAVPAPGSLAAAVAADGERLSGFVRDLAAVHRAAATADITWNTYDDAVATRDTVSAELAARMDVAGDAAYRTITTVRAAAVRDITARGADLARLADVVPVTTEPALVVAHRLYGDASREVDVVGRSAARHPGFLPGGVALKVPAHD